jgi:hypothetical protein
VLVDELADVPASFGMKVVVGWMPRCCYLSIFMAMGYDGDVVLSRLYGFLTR